MNNHHLMTSKKLLLNSYFYKTNHNGWLTRAIRFFISSPPRDSKYAMIIFNLPQKITKLASQEKNFNLWQTYSYPVCFPTKTLHKSPAYPVFSNAVQANKVKVINFWG